MRTVIWLFLCRLKWVFITPVLLTVFTIFNVWLAKKMAPSLDKPWWSIFVVNIIVETILLIILALVAPEMLKAIKGTGLWFKDQWLLAKQEARNNRRK